MNNEMEQNKESLSYEELQNMLKEIEQVIGTDEMNRQLEDFMQKLADNNPNSAESKVMRIQKGNLEEMLMQERYADYSSAEHIAELLHTYYEKRDDESFSAVLIELSWCMMNEGAVLVPTIMRDGRLDMPLMNDDEGGDWIPLFTSPEIAKAWPEETQMQPIALEMAVLLAIVRSDFKGVVLNPGTDEPMPLDRMLLEHVERACNETRQEEARLAKEQQNDAPGVLN